MGIFRVLCQSDLGSMATWILCQFQWPGWRLICIHHCRWGLYLGFSVYGRAVERPCGSNIGLGDTAVEALTGSVYSCIIGHKQLPVQMKRLAGLCLILFFHIFLKMFLLSVSSNEGNIKLWLAVFPALQHQKSKSETGKACASANSIPRFHGLRIASSGCTLALPVLPHAHAAVVTACISRGLSVS